MTQTEVFTLDPRTLSDNASPASERPAVVGHTSVRAALRNHARYSSDLQGDRDVRTYKQLPLEVDPPDHGLFRAVLTPIFSAERVQPFKQVFRELYPVTQQERSDGALSYRYAGQQINPTQAFALWSSRGWSTQDDVFNVSGTDPLKGRGAYAMELATAIEALGGVDILVNNAGIL
ncbi:MAG: DUF4132 domain-containing protein, partial [Actinomycetes bacterium]